MSKTRKTKRQKVKTAERVRQEGFLIKEEWLVSKNGTKKSLGTTDLGQKYFKSDLTKTLVLTMLVLALEIAVWQYLTRR